MVQQLTVLIDTETELKDQFERIMLEYALALSDGHRTHAAKMCGLSVRGFRNAIQRYPELNKAYKKEKKKNLAQETEELIDVDKIVILFTEGKSVDSIAREMKVSREIVRRIIHTLFGKDSIVGGLH